MANRLTRKTVAHPVATRPLSPEGERLPFAAKAHGRGEG